MKRRHSNSAPSSATTQRANILRALVSSQGGWVPSPQIAALAQQYNARLFELRKLGYCIENKSETDEATGERHSWFRLLRQSPPDSAAHPDPYPHGATGLPLFDAVVPK